MKGSIGYRSSDDRWCGRFNFNNKTRYIYAKTKKECLEKMKEEQIQLEIYGDANKEKETKQKKVIDRSMTLNTWFEYWFENYKVPKLRESTAIVRKQVYITNVFNSKLGKTSIDKINVDTLRDFILNLKSSNAKKTTYAILKDMYDILFKSGYISKNYMDLVVIKFDPFPRKEKKILSKEDEVRLFNEVLIGTKYFDIAKLMLYQALRVGEALALCWEDIDFTNNTININKSYSSVTHKITEVKTITSKDSIPMFKETKEMLLNRGYKTKGLIFPEFIGTNFNNNFDAYCKARDMVITPHVFRHTFASRAFENGINPKTVQTILRHKSYETTINAYTHLSDEMKEDAIEQINDMQSKVLFS